MVIGRKWIFLTDSQKLSSTILEILSAQAESIQSHCTEKDTLLFPLKLYLLPSHNMTRPIQDLLYSLYELFKIAYGKRETTNLSLNSFRMVQDFIKEIFECNFFSEPADKRIKQISILMNARWAINQIMKERWKTFDKEFMKYVFPILEVVVQWNELKKSGRLSDEFVERCKERMTTGASSNFLGVIFEIDMATRSLLSGWKADFLEDYTGKNKQIDLLIEKPHGEKIGLECTSKRATEEINTVKINETISEKNEKFNTDHVTLLPTKLDMRIVIIDITREDYGTPVVLRDLDKVVIGPNLDGGVLTWREDLVEGTRHSLRIKYESLGNIDKDYFTTTWAAEFFPPTQERGPAFALRKYTEPEPQHGEWGPEETCGGNVK